MAALKQPPADELLVKRVLAAMDVCEPVHTRWRRKANHVFSLYNNFQDFKSALADASPRGQDDVVRDAQATWGSDLFIPMAFGTVEATVPLVIAMRPRMLADPRDERSQANVENVQYMIDAQQQQIHYELILQEIAKTALIYGLAVQKVYWDTRYRTRTRLVPSEAPRSLNPTGYAKSTTLEATFDDPRAESIDPFDFFWDPFGKDIDTCGYVVQRSWRSMKYIAQQAQLGKWRNVSDLGIVESMGNSQKYDQAWSERMRALGFGTVAKRGGERQHEVLEFWDNDEVVVVLDREVCVSSGENPHWHGEKPFQIYRPTHIPGRFEGKGLIEPIEDLQKEINELRRSRRDNAYLILQKCFAFHDGMLETDNFKFGPGLGIPVNGDPREILFPINVGDIPYAGYQEEAALKDDVQFTTGLSDPTDSSGVQTTATGAQLVHQATSRRAALMTRRLELEIIQQGTSQMHGLNQQKILANRTVRIAQPPTPSEPDRRWSWKQLGPDELAGEFEWTPEGTTGAANVPQDRSDATDQWTMFHDNPNVDQQALIADIFKKYGHKHPEMFIAPPKAEAPAEVLDVIVKRLVAMGMNEAEAKAMVAQSLNEALAIQQGQPPPSTPSPNGQPVPTPA